jgi:hypothetical protein
MPLHFLPVIAPYNSRQQGENFGPGSVECP